MRTVIVDDVALIRVALRNILTEQGYEIVGEAASAAEAIKEISMSRPDLVILDFHLGANDGFDVYHALQAQGIETKIVVLTAISDVHLLSKLAFDTNIAGLVSKSNQPALLDALEAIKKGELYLDPTVLKNVVTYKRMLKDLPSKHADVMYWMVKGFSNDMISEKLDLGVRTISNYRSGIRRIIKNDTLVKLRALLMDREIPSSCS